MQRVLITSPNDYLDALKKKGKNLSKHTFSPLLGWCPEHGFLHLAGDPSRASSGIWPQQPLPGKCKVGPAWNWLLPFGRHGRGFLAGIGVALPSVCKGWEESRHRGQPKPKGVPLGG